MTTNARSIDAAASGFIRHKFVRALSASLVVAAIFGIIALTFGVLVGAAQQGQWDQVATAPISIPLVVLLFLLPVIVAVALIGALIDIVHRRIVALLLFAASLFGLFFFAAGGLALFAAAAGWDINDGQSEPITREEALAFALISVVAALIAYQLVRQSWWQLTVSAANFRAVRGWRPPPWRILTSLRRNLGLPGFLSYVGKKRRVVTLLYFGVAVLNIGIVLLLILPSAIAADTAATEGLDPVVAYAIMGALLVLNLIGAGTLLAKLADAGTTKLYQNVREWDQRAPIVFLRSFNQDDDRVRCIGGDPFARWPAGVGRPRTLDEILLEHGSPYGPVIAIGDPRDPTPPLGAARVFVEGEGAEWQGVVRGLAGASKAVVMCPNRGEGVQWELDLIAQAGGRLRTIFLASPELDRADTLALFQRLVPNVPEISAEQHAIAAYACDGEWRVLTAKKLSVETYSAALNTALQALFGLKGEAAKKPKGPS